jgi:hypothetical protein
MLNIYFIVDFYLLTWKNHQFNNKNLFNKKNLE